ncbi:hypothetical protein [Cupriavidus necator]|uniref:hypothetical protein n=1 Tax=Cupriavidus necator TaxID=106590 RepID=UPI0009B82205
MFDTLLPTPGAGAEVRCRLTIDYRGGDIAAAMQAWARGGADLALDAVGCGSLPNGMDLLKPGGTGKAATKLVLRVVEPRAR